MGLWALIFVQVVPTNTKSSLESLIQHLGPGGCFQKNSGTPKWINFIMENPMKMDDFGRKPTIFGKPPGNVLQICRRRWKDEKMIKSKISQPGSFHSQSHHDAGHNAWGVVKLRHSLRRFWYVYMYIYHIIWHPVHHGNIYKFT